MKNQVHLIFPKNGGTVVDGINANLDNVEASYSLSVPEFISKSKSNKYYPKRILLLTNSIVDNSALEELYFYLRENSENTEVVLICNYNDGLSDSNVVSGFKDIFQESIYNVAYSTRWGIKTLMRAVTDSLPELEERSLLFEKENNIRFTPAVSLNSSGFGESSDGAEEEEESAQTDGEELVDEDFTWTPATSGVWGVEEVDNSPEHDFASSSVEENTEESSIDAASSPEEEEGNDNIFSLGNFGGMHVETGFLSEDSEGEWIEEEKHKDVKPAPEAPTLKEQLLDRVQHDTAPERVSLREAFTTAPNAPVDKHPVTTHNKAHGLTFNSADGTVRIMTGTRDVDTSNWVIETAVNLQNKGEKVLVVDLDVKYNNILSNIDVNEWSKSQTNGLGVYEEDGLFFLSAGYGRSEVVDTLALVKRLVRKRSFNTILIDCPMDVLNESIFDVLGDNLSVTLVVNGNYQSFIRLYVAAEEVPSGFARHYFYNGEVQIVGGSADWKEDLNEVRGIVTPGRVDWLNDAYLG